MFCSVRSNTTWVEDYGFVMGPCGDVRHTRSVSQTRPGIYCSRVIYASCSANTLAAAITGRTAGSETTPGGTVHGEEQAGRAYPVYNPLPPQKRPTNPWTVARPGNAEGERGE